MADDDAPPKKSGDNPITKVIDWAKDVPWYYWLGATLAGGAVLYGVSQRNGAGATSTQDTGIPQAFTTSPLDFASQNGIADGGGGLPGSTSTPPMPGPTPGPVGTPSGNEYIVQLGDTLDSIAKRYSVPGGWQAIYQNNQQVIDATAKKYGHQTNEQNYIYQGEILYLPKK